MDPKLLIQEKVTDILDSLYEIAEKVSNVTADTNPQVQLHM